jgi:hypothetical protein
VSAARVAVTGLGLVCPLGAAFNEQVAVLATRLAAGERALRPHPPLAQLPDGGWAGVVGALDLDRFLLRRKDKKLLARPLGPGARLRRPLGPRLPG